MDREQHERALKEREDRKKRNEDMLATLAQQQEMMR